MKIIDISQASGTLAEYVRTLSEEPIVIMDGAQPLAILTLMDKEDRDSWVLADDPRFKAIIEQAEEEDRAGLGYSSEEVRRMFGLPEPVEAPGSTTP